VRATKPLDIGGTIVDGLTVRFESGRAVEIEAERGADILRERASFDGDASRLGEVALVDREGRIGPLGTTFYNTLLDENAASHIALGNAYEITVAEEDVPKINQSEIHMAAVAPPYTSRIAPRTAASCCWKSCSDMPCASLACCSAWDITSSSLSALISASQSKPTSAHLSPFAIVASSGREPGP
jgi:hypothetical protein